MWRRNKKNITGGDQALEEAKRALEEVRKERDDVEGVSRFLKIHRTENHWSQRLDLTLRSR